MSENIEHEVHELKEKEHEREKKEQYEAGYRAATKKIRRTICAVSASAALTGFGVIKYISGWVFDKFHAIQIAWEAFRNAGGFDR